MSLDSESSLSPAQDNGADDLSDTIRDALEEQAGEDIIGELASVSDDAPDTTGKLLNIHTLEALVELSDAGLLNIGTGARQLQRGAKLFLEQAPPKAADTSAESADLRVENERLTARVTELETKTAEQREKIKRQAKKIGALKPKKAA